MASGAVYGYSIIPVVENGKRVRTEYAINEDEAAFVREIWDRHWLRNEGYRTIAIDFNARAAPGAQGRESWERKVTPRLVCDVANNLRYTGTIIYGAIKKTYKKGTKVRVKREEKDVQVHDAPHLRIVSLEAQRAQQTARASLDASKNNDSTKRGPKAKHLLVGIARCGVWGGPMQEQGGRNGARYYRCGRNRDMGHTVCTNNLLRPVAEADRAVVGAINRHLDEDVIARVIAQVAKQLALQTKKSNAELPRLQEERAKLTKEIDRLAEAVATSPNVSRRASRSPRRRRPSSTSRLKRLEVATRKRLAELYETMRGNIPEARQALQSMLDGPLTMTPREDASGREYAITGRLVLGDALGVGTAAPSRQDQARGLLRIGGVSEKAPMIGARVFATIPTPFYDSSV